MCVHHFSPFQRGAINFPLHRFRASIRRSLAVRKWVEPYHIVGLTPQNARASDPNVWRGEQASTRASPIAGAIEAKSETELGAPRESAGAILAIIVCYFKNGLPDRSSNQPAEVVKPQGGANGRRLEFESIPRAGTGIRSGSSWVVFKHHIQAEEAGPHSV